MRDKWGRPPLHLAASRGLEEVCLGLVGRPDLDINAQAQWGLGTGFHAAAAAGLEEVRWTELSERTGANVADE